VAGRTGVDETGYHSADNVDDDIDKIDESITSSAAGAAAASGTKVSLHTRANNSQQQGMMGNMAYYSCAPSRHA
jgi:phage tail tape-measure protein